MRRKWWTVLAVGAACGWSWGLQAQEEFFPETAWRPLVDGDSMEGWKQLGGEARYEIRDGVVTGSAVRNTPNSFLATERDYGDFLLAYEFKVAENLNSGVQIRSQSLAELQGGRVHGYQVEIDPSDRAWTGGIYDESRRGWLNDLSGNEAAREAFRQGDWNAVLVLAEGDRIRTWLNGVPAADLTDSMTLSGFIALQVHGIGGDEGKEGAQVQWRNLQIKDVGRSVWKPLWNGKDFEGWNASPGGQWEVRDGVIAGSSPASEGRHGILFSDNVFSDFTVRLKFRSVKGNSGFYFRVEKVDSPVAAAGFQAEIAPHFETGGLYETEGRGWVAQAEAGQLEKIYKPGEWTDMTVSARGGDVRVFVNHRQTAALLDDPGRREGLLGLQLHGGEEMEVYFKDLEVLTKE